MWIVSFIPYIFFKYLSDDRLKLEAQMFKPAMLTQHLIQFSLHGHFILKTWIKQSLQRTPKNNAHKISV